MEQGFYTATQYKPLDSTINNDIDHKTHNKMGVNHKNNNESALFEVINNGCFVKQMCYAYDNDDDDYSNNILNNNENDFYYSNHNNNNNNNHHRKKDKKNVCVLITNIPYNDKNDNNNNNNNSNINTNNENNTQPLHLLQPQITQQDIFNSPTTPAPPIAEEEESQTLTEFQMQQQMYQQQQIQMSNIENTQTQIQTQTEIQRQRQQGQTGDDEKIADPLNDDTSIGYTAAPFILFPQPSQTPSNISPASPKKIGNNKQSYYNNSNNNQQQQTTLEDPEFMNTLFEILKDANIDINQYISDIIAYKLEFDQALYHEMDIYSNLKNDPYEASVLLPCFCCLVFFFCDLLRVNCSKKNTCHATQPFFLFFLKVF